MKRDVNQLLLALLFMACLGMVVIVLYYNATFESVNNKYQSSLESLENTSAVLNQTLFEVAEKEVLLSAKEELLEQYLSELNLSKTRESSLGSHYENLTRLSEDLEDDLTSVSSDRDKWRSEYNEARDAADVCQADLRIKSNKINSMVSDIDAVMIKISESKVEVRDMQDMLIDMNADLEDIDHLTNNATIEEEVSALKSTRSSMSSRANSILDRLDLAFNALSKIK